MGSTPSHLIAVEGAIATGKTTFLKTLEQCNSLDVYCEPVNIWRNFESFDVLKLFYSDPNRYATSFQHLVALTQGEILNRAPKGSTKILERSPQSSLEIFVRVLRQEGVVDPLDFALLTQRYDTLIDRYPITKYIYIKSDPLVNYRVAERRSRLETDSPNIEYFKRISLAYDKFFTSQIRKGSKVLIVTAYDNSVLSQLSLIFRKGTSATIEQLFSLFAANHIEDRVHPDQLEQFAKSLPNNLGQTVTTTNQGIPNNKNTCGKGLAVLAVLTGATVVWTLLKGLPHIGIPCSVPEFNVLILKPDT